MADYLLLESGDHLELEDGLGDLLLESSSSATVNGTLAATFGGLTATMTGSVIVPEGVEWSADLMPSHYRADLIPLDDF